MGRKNAPIIIIDNDQDEINLIREALKSLKVDNQILSFTDSTKVLEHLKNNITLPFFVLCDINMPKMNGFELRDQIQQDEELRFKLIPFLFYSTTNDLPSVMRAYNKSVQGYFKKPLNFEGIKTMLHSIIDYWRCSENPNSVEK